MGAHTTLEHRVETPSRDLLPEETLIRELLAIRADMHAYEAEHAAQIQQLDPAYRESARNLLHYLALRRRDIRTVQQHLAERGLSSLGRAEAHVLYSIHAVLNVLYLLAQRHEPLAALRTGEAADEGAGNALTLAEGRNLLTTHTQALLGAVPANRTVRIMVTMPSEAADDFLLVRDMLLRGMNCMRINCAHDDPSAWQRMIANLRRAERDVGRRCHVLMDLSGPKLRTGEIAPGPPVVKWRPQRDAYGRVLAPARIWLTPQENPQTAPAEAEATLPLPGSWLARLHRGDRVTFRDTRGAARSMTVVSLAGTGRWVTCEQTAYIATGTRLVHKGTHENDSGFTPHEALVGEIPPMPAFLLLKPGDMLVLTRDQTPGQPATCDAQGRLLTPAQIPCTLPEVFSDTRIGERILLDDGKIGGVIKSVRPDRIEVQITQARPTGEKLRAEKGINLPDSQLRLSALTEKDQEDLRFVAAHADLVGLSFIQSARDVQDLQARLVELGGKSPGIILKIETRRAFENLPELLMAAMRFPRAGVMIARGDLAVECGYERLAEVQEEILWICEAAHLPVIWATQVLETLAQTGLPSRAEITDAAMGVRAECVMLNKGPHIVEAIQVLDGILQRMQAHQSKKTTLLRQLHAWNKEPE
jgi:pyruvate kinase